ncbi:MAG TPA: hypothetical protein VJT54_16070, partial [Verrucomicrobiae bacterium]|nr:hypothetical protein [Verrucomicrobiae bacterium]
MQVQLADVSGIEWVERGRLDQARRELELSAMEAPGGVPYIRLGKWVKADWMVTGQFSVDDRNRRTLFLEITDLQHADVLASQRLIFPTNVVSQIKLEMPQVDFAAQTLRRLLSKAHLHQEQMADKVLVAPLFLADVTRFGHGFGFSRNTVMLEKDLNDALERAATADGHVHLISFPEAYRSLNESEMVLNGLIEADRNAWQQTADLYVWGTCATTSRMVPGKLPEEKMEIMLHIWNGASQPMILKEELPARAQANQIETAMEHLANQVIADAHKHTIRANPDAISRQIAESLLQAYDQMTLGTPHNREDFGLNDPEKFLQTIHMLETACFFDPDNVNARVLYITCRWGFWMDFTFKVKNEFWSKWRRSQAWGQYVEQFGLKPVAIELPFPYQQEDG